MTALCERVQRAYPAPATDADRWWQPTYLGGTAPTLEAAGPIEAEALAKRAARKQKRTKG
jgi:hypothetical protein